MVNQSVLLKDAQDYASDLLSSKISKDACFHTLEHTRDVVIACEKIAEQVVLSEDEKLALFIAAWFHDTGYSAGLTKDHELASIQHVTGFFNTHPVAEDIISKVRSCILATRMPQKPVTPIEQILCDADLFHLGSDNFKEKNRLLRDELKNFNGEKFSKKEWKQKNIAFLEAHQYFTDYGQRILQPGKEKHLAGLKEKSHPDTNKADTKIIDKKKKEPEIFGPDTENAKTRKLKERQTERGVNTAFRIIAQNQSNLSQMADSKANILISVNSIILTIVISTLFTKLDSNSNLQIPVILLVVVCVSAIVFSILATRPTITHGTFTEDDIHSKRTNLLFFGNFYKMSLLDYDWAMKEMLNDKNYLYSSIVKDNYFLGVVLAKKYRLLRIAYNVFMYGLIIAMLAFAVALIVPEVTEVYTPG